MKLFGRPGTSWEDNINMYLTEMLCGLDSTGAGLKSLSDCCEHGNEPSGSIKGVKFLDQLSEC
jgi:hypothetical protein